MLNRYIIILILNIFSFSLSQSIIVEGKVLDIGMKKTHVLQLMQEYLDYESFDEDDNDFWLQNDTHIIGSIGFIDGQLDYVTTELDNQLDYLDSIHLFNTLFTAIKNTFGPNYKGEIKLQLKELQDENLEKLEINLFSDDGKSVRINRNNISLDITQAAKKL